MKKLWLTYAWADNESEDVDFVAQEIRKRGIDVKLDRNHLIAGQRLWPQIDAAITDPAKSDAWAIYVTEKSLKSEPCQEELAYALDRALRSREEGFPIIGIFPHAIDRKLVPSSIATRLYVDLRQSDWADRVADGVTHLSQGRPEPSIAPFHIATTVSGNGEIIVEVRPRAGRWYPFYCFVLEQERQLLKNAFFGPSGGVPLASMTAVSEVPANNGYAGLKLGHAIDAQNSAYLQFAAAPSTILFGELPNLLQVFPGRG
ncbi:hypothetical protein CK222_27365 [Mesorhizobium sp. WSM3866]|uniref:toll/interleukin-1 receptor domain-containing protein n=1 Tax=Mesorhizobium sp. WSM3866 TaxID=422271 RepID=UPI000BAF8A46|nr:toll/interleukin-1 receptor domain-containing protein [Mesorhizobium sp. WSM3866]PBB40570.1 hypothetical protein CK222_27365 [Mesorhizobium sp. WSM3866]